MADQLIERYIDEQKIKEQTDFILKQLKTVENAQKRFRQKQERWYVVIYKISIYGLAIYGLCKLIESFSNG